MAGIAARRNGPEPDVMELDQLLANTADGVCAVGSDGKIVMWNRAAEKMLGYTARDVLGRPCCEVFVGRDVAGNRLCYQGCHVLTLVRRGEPVQHFDMATRNKTSQPVWLNISILIVPGAHRDVSTTVRRDPGPTASARVFQVAMLTWPSSSISAQARWTASTRAPSEWSSS